jgi:hypothetical protein
MTAPSRALLALLLLGTLLGCQPALREGGGRPLERIEAIQLAVQLANAECQERYQCAPFTEASYTIALADGRWTWGGLDVVGEGGFSARVEFDARGGDREAEVFYSTDAVRPLY